MKLGTSIDGQQFKITDLIPEPLPMSMWLKMTQMESYCPTTHKATKLNELSLLKLNINLLFNIRFPKNG